MSHTDKRVEILRSTLEIIAANGFHGAPMSMIAERANIAMGSIYRCFESKELLIHALRNELEERFREEVMREFPARRPLRERFLHVSRIFVQHCLESPLDFRFLEQFYNSPYGVAYRRDQILGAGILQALLEEAQREQILKLLPHTVLSALIFGPLLCLVRDQILGFIELDQPLIDRTVEACWDAIRH
jgi:AcrR family transcriptional regulator